MQLAEARLGRPVEEIIRELYVKQGQTQSEVAAVIGVDLSTISVWMLRLGIEARQPGRPPKAAA